MGLVQLVTFNRQFFIKMESVIVTLNIIIYIVKLNVNCGVYNCFLVLALTRRNSNVIAILQFLHRLIQVKKGGKTEILLQRTFVGIQGIFL